VALQPLGNDYARSEFKSHKQCTKEQADLFMTEWTKYAINLAQQLGLRGKSEKPLGEHLDDTKLEHLRDEQVAQLYELLLAAKGMDENDRKILDNVEK
jgi:Complex1_LYR-like